MKKIFLPFLLLICYNTFGQSGFTYYQLPSGYGATAMKDKNGLELDANGNVWVAFERIGLGKFNIASQTWTMYDTTNSPLKTDTIRSLAIDGNGNIWAGTIRGLYKFDTANWTLYHPSNSSIPDSVIQSLMVSGSDLLIGTNKGFCIMNGNNFTNYSTQNSSIVADTVRCIEKTPGTDIFLGTEYGLSRFDGIGFTNFTTSNSALVNNSITSLKYAVNGILWISTPTALCQLSGNTVYSFPLCNYDYNTNYFRQNLGNIECDNNGNAITILYSKLLRLHRNYKAEEITWPAQGIPLQLHRVRYDTAGKLWMAYAAFSFAPGLVCYDSSASTGFTQAEATSAFIDINEVAAMIHNRGDMYWDLSGNHKYEVPKCSGKHAAVVSALLIGGIDNGGNLKAAAMSYRQTGVDYWAGPLDTTNGSFDSTLAAPYDRIWKVNRFTVEDFKYHFLNGSVSNGTWPVPEEILTWPAQGSGNFTRDLAPFADFNADGIYNPYDGDYPLIKGDQMLYYIFNDNAGIKDESNSAPFPFEIHGSVYAFTCPALPDSEQVLNYTTFYNFKIINRGTFTYDSTYMGFFTDNDLGYYNDDYGGCDSVLNNCFVYNGDNDDNLPDGYGLNPPMINNMILKGPQPDPNDGVDNDHDGTIDEAGEMNMLSNFQTFVGDNAPPNGNCAGLNDVYHYLTGSWRDGVRMTYGGMGYNVGSTDYTHYQFSGIPYDTSGWTELTANNLPTEKRYIASSGPFSIAPGESRELDYAVVFTWDSLNPNGLNTSIAKNTHDLQKIKYWFDNNNFPSCLPLNVSVNEMEPSNRFEIYPNPAKEELIVNGYWLSGERVELNVFDLFGRIIFETLPQTSNIKLQTASYAPGVYLIAVKDKSGIAVKKFIKQ